MTTATRKLGLGAAYEGAGSVRHNKEQVFLRDSVASAGAVNVKHRGATLDVEAVYHEHWRGYFLVELLVPHVEGLGVGEFGGAGEGAVRGEANVVPGGALDACTVQPHSVIGVMARQEALSELHLALDGAGGEGAGAVGADRRGRGAPAGQGRRRDVECAAEVLSEGQAAIVEPWVAGGGGGQGQGGQQEEQEPGWWGGYCMESRTSQGV